jgi:hypothetical protein
VGAYEPRQPRHPPSRWAFADHRAEGVNPC